MTDSAPTTIAVASGKGGVGKSTVAALLALAYAEKGMEVALLDADLYGPSLPTLFHLEGVRHDVSKEQKIIPIRHGALQLVSFGFILGQLPAIMRGPMIARYTAQLLNDVLWEPHQLLIIDLPPGTGDIHLTTTQSQRIDSAVIVTTPHALSFSDVGKAILMLNKVKVPIAGFVLNMAYFVCAQCNTSHDVFGSAALETVAMRFGIPALASLPIDATRYGQRMSSNTSPENTEHAAHNAQNTAPPPPSTTSDVHNNTPAHPSAPTNEIHQLAEKIWHEARTSPPPQIVVENRHSSITIVAADGMRFSIEPYQLRIACRCALCYDEYRDMPLHTERVPKNIFAEQIKLIGNYALYIKWSDGHDTGFFPLDYIYSICNKTQPAVREQ